MQDEVAGGDLSTKNRIVSVVIPTDNSSATLRRCLASIQHQSYPHHEIIVIDNHSRDSTVEIAKEFGVRVIIHRGNRSSARNVGIRNSLGNYVLFLDSDQFLESRVVFECVELCENGKSGMVFIPEVFMGSNFWGSCSAFWKNCHLRVDEQVRERRRELFDCVPRFFVKEYLSSAGLLNEDLVWREDYEFYRRLRSLGVGEAWCKSRIFHNEPSSIRKMVIKNFRYGKFMHKFLNQTRNGPFLSLFNKAFLVLWEALKNLRETPQLTVGCLLFLFLKAFATTLGLLSFLLDQKQAMGLAKG